MKIVSIFLVAVALIAGMVGCVGGNGNSGDSYTLIIDITTGGTVTVDDVPLPGKAILTYDAGMVVSLNAIPSADYHFVNWIGNVSTIDDINAASTTITINDNYYITANFIAQYALTIDSTDGGEVTTPGEGMFSYDAGTVVDLVTEPVEGYKFLNWTGDVDTIANVTAASTTITMEGDCVVTANFLPEYIYLDKIGPESWCLFIIGEGVEAAVTDAGVVVDIASDPVEDPQGQPYPHFLGGGWKLDLLEGDFDIRMNYELTTWPQGSGASVGLSVGVPDVFKKFVNVERIGLSPGQYPGFEPREVYKVLIDDNTYSFSGTYDLSGTLRIRREGAIVSCYYGTPENWHKLYEAEWSTVGVRVMIGAWSNNDDFGGKEVSVLLRTVEIVEPPL